MYEVTTRHFIIATAGHVDHGKSALVKALTGTDPDRLPEEKKRRITIDLGFAALNVTAPNGDKIQAGIVDVPGHEDFVRNMIAGVGSIDLALFAVAADDGWMPQSEEHLQILNYLGVQRAVIALTKTDLGAIDVATNQIRERLSDTPFADSPIVPTSVRTGAGIENLVNTLASQLARTEPQRDIRKPRLFIDRVFTLGGIGTVVTGTLTGGSLRRSEKIVVYPTNFEPRIRSIQSHGQELEVAHPGMRTAINLPDLQVEQIKRGDVVTLPDHGAPSSTLIVLVEKPSRPKAEKTVTRSLKNGSSIYVHHGASRVAARIRFRENGSLEAGKQKFAQLTLGSPIFAFIGDRFVVRDSSERHTIAGGIVLDPDGNKESLASSVALDNVDAFVRATVARQGFARRESVLSKSRFSADEISAALINLEQNNEIILFQDIAADCEFWRKLRGQAIGLIEAAHKETPERAGVDLGELRSALRIQESEVLELLVADLCEGDFVRKGSVIARTSHRPTLPVHVQLVEKRIREALAGQPFDPPSRKAIESDPQARQVVRFLIENGDVTALALDVVLLRESFERMKSQVIEFISKNGPATVSQLRQALRSSRRVMVPLLERLDRDGVTSRAGDKRRLRI
ncbi:MAG: selenocysteine-specific translation elongation factor [Verrucomicrobia bacterium]|nr:MAG: selenocysteine-specific translation elongation factor [Verrucomicrobiota bacterium]